MSSSQVILSLTFVFSGDHTSLRTFLAPVAVGIIISIPGSLPLWRGCWAVSAAATPFVAVLAGVPCVPFCTVFGRPNYGRAATPMYCSSISTWCMKFTMVVLLFWQEPGVLSVECSSSSEPDTWSVCNRGQDQPVAAGVVFPHVT